jgi:catechol 2,3-dioxygenase-like lactoylglutathione lyase family enzyme
MKLEVVNLPVSDIDRAKRFYQSLGWRLDGDFAVGDFAGLTALSERVRRFLLRWRTAIGR